MLTELNVTNGPALTYWSLHPLVGFGQVSDLHARSVPLQLLTDAGTLGQVAQQVEFGQTSAVVEAGLGFGTSGAAGIQEIGKDIALNARHSSRRLVHGLHFFHG